MSQSCSRSWSHSSHWGLALSRQGAPLDLHVELLTPSSLPAPWSLQLQVPPQGTQGPPKVFQWEGEPNPDAMGHVTTVVQVVTVVTIPPPRQGSGDQSQPWM